MVLYLHWGSPRHEHRLGEEILESSSIEKDLRVLVDQNLGMTQQCEFSAWNTDHILGCTERVVLPGGMAGGQLKTGENTQILAGFVCIFCIPDTKQYQSIGLCCSKLKSVAKVRWTRPQVKNMELHNNTKTPCTVMKGKRGAHSLSISNYRVLLRGTQFKNSQYPCSVAILWLECKIRELMSQTSHETKGLSKFSICLLNF